MTRAEIEELKGLASSMGLYDDKKPCKRAVILGKAIKALERQPCEDCISREEALKNQFTAYDHVGVEYKVVLAEMLKILPSVQPKVVPIAEIRFDDDKLHEIVDEAIKNIEITPRWIPVSERLPRSHGVYQVTIQCEEGRYTSACYFDGSNTWHNDNRINHGRPYVTDKVIAWQEEPEPYKAESEVKEE